MKLIFAAVCMVSALGISKLHAGAPAEMVVAAPVEESSVVEQPQEEWAICPRGWTCDHIRWYGSQATCQTRCPDGVCEMDYNCNGTCVCP